MLRFNCYILYLWIMKKRKKNEGYICRIRNLIGMPQDEFAEAIGVSRTLLSLAEIGMRQLPVEASGIVVALASALLSEDGEAIDEPAKPVHKEDAGPLNELKAKLNENFISFHHHKNKIDKHTAELKRYQRLKRALPLLKDKVSLRESYLVGKITEACNKLEISTGAAAVVRLEKRLHFLEMEKAYLENQIAIVERDNH